MFGESLVPPNKPNPSPMSIKRCSKFQGLGHTTLVCPNQETITLAKWEAVMKKETTEGPEQIIKKEDEEARDEELLVLKRFPSQQEGVKDGPSNYSPTPPISQTLK